MKTTTILACLLLILHAAKTQNKTENYFQSNPKELYFSFILKDKQKLSGLDQIISIDRVNGDTIFAYASPVSFSRFLEKNIAFNVLQHPSTIYPAIIRDTIDIRNISSWDFYPSYTGYISMMGQFQSEFPSLCKLFTLGESVQGRHIMAVRITGNNSQQKKPEFLYSSTMHGDETTGYVVLLRLIDYLLKNYGSDPLVTRLMDNIEIWIAPLTNPDGTYASGNNSVNGATRNNANGVDLNRNYPTLGGSLNPDNNVWQKENIAMMNFTKNRNFIAGANIHGGAEVLNYPWDAVSRFHADNAWWVYTMREYADTAQYYSPSGYLTDLNSGITNGYAWYSIKGSRQDYMNYFHGCREFTLEISKAKLPAAIALPAFWEYNYQSLLNFIEQATFGLHGRVLNAENLAPVAAKIVINNHDADRSYVFSQKESGHYYRLLKAGNYKVAAHSPCYHPLTKNNISISDRQTSYADFLLEPLIPSPIVTGASTCSSSGTLSLYAEGSGGEIEWHSSTSGADYLTSGNSFTTPELFESQTWYVREAGGRETHTGGAADTSFANGNYYNAGNVFYMHFDCFHDIELTSVSVYALDAGERQFLLKDGLNNTLLDTLIYLENGLNVLDLNIFLPKSYGYKLGAGAEPNLYRNTASTSYPYVLGDAAEITGNNYSANHYFYFYNWVVKNAYPCYSNFIPVHAIVSEQLPTAAFDYIATDSIVSLLNHSHNAESFVWYFGDGDSSTVENPVHIFPYNGNYEVTLIAYNECGTDTTFLNISITTGSDKPKGHNQLEISIFPNPTDDMLTFRSNQQIIACEIFELSGTILQKVEINHKYSADINISHIKSGMYFVRFSTENSRWLGKIIKVSSF